MGGYGPTELFVANFVGIQEELVKLFSKQGLVKDFWVSQKKGFRVPAPGSGLFGVVRMATHQDALAAKKALHDTGFNGKTLSVKWASNQRVLWVGNLGPSVTNEALETAFGQFGAIERCIVAINPETGVSRRYGFVAFDKKEDAQRALNMCRANLFMIGALPHPVAVELAWIEDSDEGFTEAVKLANQKGRQPKPAPPVGLPSHFAQTGTAEHALASQLREFREQYKQAKERLKAELREAEARSLAHGPLADHMPHPQPNSGLASWPPPVQVATAAQETQHGQQYQHESFHDTSATRAVKRQHTTGYSEHRYQPGPSDAPPPDLLPGQQAPPSTQPPASGVRSAFVRGGELHTVEAAEERQLQHMPPQVPANETTGTLQTQPAGRHDHSGIGYSTHTSHPQAPQPVVHEPRMAQPPPQQPAPLGANGLQQAPLPPWLQPSYSQPQAGMPPATPSQQQYSIAPPGPSYGGGPGAPPGMAGLPAGYAGPPPPWATGPQQPQSSAYSYRG